MVGNGRVYILDLDRSSLNLSSISVISRGRYLTLTGVWCFVKRGEGTTPLTNPNPLLPAKPMAHWGETTTL